jgi:hypothetical protein
MKFCAVLCVLLRNLKKISDKKVPENSLWTEKTQNVMLISKPVGKLQKSSCEMIKVNNISAS